MLFWRKSFLEPRGTLGHSVNTTASGRTGTCLAYLDWVSVYWLGPGEESFKTTDYSRSPDGRWNKDLVLKVVLNTFEEYICAAAIPAHFVIEAGEHVPGLAPEVAEEAVNARRARLVPRDFVAHGYTGGCPGCIQLQRGGGVSRNHSEACRSRM